MSGVAALSFYLEVAEWMLTLAVAVAVL